MNHQVLIAGFGGQGVLTCGQILAMAGMIEGKQVAWMPSYGPEQRGGTAYCVVTISDRPIGSPLLEGLSGALIFNEPSLTKFRPMFREGSLVILNSCIVQDYVGLPGRTVYHVPADTIAQRVGLRKAGNMVMLGSYVEASGVVSVEAAREAVAAYLGASKAHYVKVNQEALAAGLRAIRDHWTSVPGLPLEHTLAMSC